jgi:hypothetical protein
MHASVSRLWYKYVAYMTWLFLTCPQHHNPRVCLVLCIAASYCIEQGALHKRRYAFLFLLLAPNNGLSVKANIDARTRPEKRVGYHVFSCQARHMEE